MRLGRASTPSRASLVEQVALDQLDRGRRGARCARSSPSRRAGSCRRPRSLLEEQLGEVGAVLAGDAGDQRSATRHRRHPSGGLASFRRGRARSSSTSASTSVVDELVEAHLGLPAEPLADLRRVAHERRRIARAKRERLIEADVFPPVQPDVLECGGDEFLDRAHEVAAVPLTAVSQWRVRLTRAELERSAGEMPRPSYDCRKQHPGASPNGGRAQTL